MRSIPNEINIFEEKGNMYLYVSCSYASDQGMQRKLLFRWTTFGLVEGYPAQFIASPVYKVVFI